MTRQTAKPLEAFPRSTGDRQVREIVRSMADEGLDLNPPYQRGRVWTLDQKIALIHAWMTGTPTGVVILNDRTAPEWQEANGYSPFDRGEPAYVCIDGQQRISTAQDWFINNTLAVPASWFAPEDVEATEDTDDGPYVRYDSLTLARGRKFANHALLTVAMARVGTVQEEAAIYLLVNGGGTPQTDADMNNAARVKKS